MKPAGDLLFAKITRLPLIDKRKAVEEISKLDISKSFWDDYRYTRMFPLMTKNANLGMEGTSNYRPGEFEWTSIAPKTIVDWCENYVFPWLGMKTRVMVLITQPGVANYEHIDCERNELNTLQHKFRIVLQGKTSTLYWITDKGNVAAPEIDEAFIMDGGWPHGMINTTDDVKITLALGAPWNGKDDYKDDVVLLQNRNDHSMPIDIDHLWKKH